MNAILLCAVIFATGATRSPQAHVDNHTTHDGAVVTAEAGRLTMIDARGKTRAFEVTESARISKNGMPAKLEDFRPGDAVRVTVDEQGAVVAISTVDIDKEILTNCAGER